MGVELAQAHRRLGARVTLLQRSTLLPRDDPELAAVVRARLLAEGVEILEGIRIVAVARSGATEPVQVTVVEGDRERSISGSTS